MKIKTKLIGALMLILGSIMGFMFPYLAKWILLFLVLLGLLNYVTENGG